ncbi:hypothetical protein AB0E99_06010 [Streptomyces sp. NPDC030592]|jgi:hypothetical protein|uniref:hypothetical protein n=1 Tax=Streptomyces TaxID=1883 RepID=UPI0018D63C40|nr:hypothetical protein [Streptomyces sp. HB-N217]MBH5131845.1 hypothetical protein [Streptomyces sp. HB-N217]
MTHSAGKGQVRSRTGLVLSALLTGGLLLVTGSACSQPPPARAPEVLPQVEAPYDLAIGKALDEVPHSEFVSLSLRPSDVRPTWLVRVADDTGSERLVRVSATDGRLQGTSVPAGQSAGTKKRTAELVAAARVLPKEAVDKVKRPDFGKVSGMALHEGSGGQPVWSVTVALVEPLRERVYEVDAVTAEVLSSLTTGERSKTPDDHG